MYRLTRGAEKLPTRPVLDASQRAVVDHRAGPLLVLAGPGHRQDDNPGRVA